VSLEQGHQSRAIFFHVGLGQDPSGETQEECKVGHVEEWRLPSLRNPYREIKDRESQQEDSGAEPVYDGTTVMTHAMCWDFKPRNVWNWGDLHYLQLVPDPDMKIKTQHWRAEVM
jgi:hypothetical protein